MAKKRYINTKFWDDEYVINLDPSEKLLFLYFLTNPLTDICGIYEISKKRIAFDTGFNIDMVDKILFRFSSDNKIHYINGWLYLKNFAKHQAMNEKVKIGINRSINEVPDEIMAKIKDIDIAYDRLSKTTNNLNSNLNLNLKEGAKAPKTRKKKREDIDELLNGIKQIVGVIDGSKQEQRNFAKNFLDSKTPEILRQAGNGNPSKEQILNATLRIFQLAKDDDWHRKNVNSLKYVYNKAASIVVSSKSSSPKIGYIS